MSVMPAFWINVFKELLGGTIVGKAGDRSLCGLFLLVVRCSMAWFFFVIVTQQLALINSTWSIKLTQHEQATKEYSVHQCGYMKTTNLQFINECERLSIVMRTSPFMAALTSVINSWNSCITMPCTQMIHMIVNHYEYRLLFLLVSFGFLYYAYQFFNSGRQKSIEIQDMIRAKVTKRYQKQVMEDYYREKL